MDPNKVRECIDFKIDFEKFKATNLSGRSPDELVNFFHLAYAGQPYFGHDTVRRYLSEAGEFVIGITDGLGKIAAAGIVIKHRAIMLGTSWDIDRYGKRADNLVRLLNACHESDPRFWFTAGTVQPTEGISRSARKAGAEKANDIPRVLGLLKEAGIENKYDVSIEEEVVVLTKASGQSRAGKQQHLWCWQDELCV